MDEIFLYYEPDQCHLWWRLCASDKDHQAVSLGSFLSSPQTTKTGKDIRLVYSDGSFCGNKKSRIQTILTLKCKPGRWNRKIHSHDIVFFCQSVWLWSFYVFRDMNHFDTSFSSLLLIWSQEISRAPPSSVASHLVAASMRWSGILLLHVSSRVHMETTVGWRILKLVRRIHYHLCRQIWLMHFLTN